MKNPTAKLIAFSLTLYSAGLPGLALADEPPLEKATLLILDETGSDLDRAARKLGEALTQARLLSAVSYENHQQSARDGAIKAAASSPSAILILDSFIPHHIQGASSASSGSGKLAPIGDFAGDYGAIAVGGDSEIYELSTLVESYTFDPAGVTFGGGSPAGGADHLIAALVMKEAGGPVKDLRYAPHPNGGKALDGLLAYNILALSTKLSRVIEPAQKGQVMILCITARERLKSLPDTPTCDEAGAEGAFLMDRYFIFAPPGTGENEQAKYRSLLQKLAASPVWAEMRAENGWADLITLEQEPDAFFSIQEKELEKLLRELGSL